MKLAHGPLQRRWSLHPLACHHDADLPMGSQATLAGPGPSLFFAAFVGFGFGFGFGHTAWLVRSWFPIQRSNPGPWPWKCRVLTTEPQVVYPLFAVYLCCCPSELQCDSWITGDECSSDRGVGGNDLDAGLARASWALLLPCLCPSRD